MPGDIFEKISLFRGLTTDQLDLLRPFFTPCDCYAETVIFEQGTPAEYLYVVVSGEVVVEFNPDDGPPITVTRVDSGGVVGWSAALGSHNYTSRAICTTYTQLLRMRGVDLRQLCAQYPDTGVVILDRLADVIAERLHSTHALVVDLLKIGLNSRAGE